MKQYKLMELMFGINEETRDIADIMSINEDLKKDVTGREEELKELLIPVFNFFEDIIRNSKE